MIAKNIIAVDPGLSGGIVAGELSTPAVVKNMPETEVDVISLLSKCIAGVGEPTLYIEKLPHFVAVPGGRVSGASMAKLHRNAGLITGAAIALGIRVVEIDPHSWQKFYRLGTKTSAGGYTAWKNKLKGEAQKRFPGFKVTHANADALLIWEYARCTQNVP
jgi:hypothetical protein